LIAVRVESAHSGFTECFASRGVVGVDILWAIEDEDAEKSG
jgi:hypothetical protein